VVVGKAELRHSQQIPPEVCPATPWHSTQTHIKRFLALHLPLTWTLALLMESLRPTPGCSLIWGLGSWNLTIVMLYERNGWSDSWVPGENLVKGLPTNHSRGHPEAPGAASANVGLENLPRQTELPLNCLLLNILFCYPAHIIQLSPASVSWFVKWAQSSLSCRVCDYQRRQQMLNY
jgi:hypothetical protein